MSRRSGQRGAPGLGADPPARQQLRVDADEVLTAARSPRTYPFGEGACDLNGVVDLTGLPDGEDAPARLRDGIDVVHLEGHHRVAKGGAQLGAFPGEEDDAAVDDAWIKDYQAVEYRNPDTYSINGYSALEVLADGVREAGSLDADRIAEAIRNAPAIETPMGQLRYDSDGDLQQQTIYIFQVQEGDWVQVFPPSPSS